jgi:hypothetical protein
MNKHSEPLQFRRSTPSERLALASRDEIVNAMAGYLVAAVLHNGLDTSRDIDVIQTLLDTPERFQSRVVLNHFDAAMYVAKQQLIAMEMSKSE